MSNLSPLRTLFPAALVALTVGGNGLAEPNTDDWACSRCVTNGNWSLDIEAGPAWVTDDAYRFGNYSGLDEKGVYPFSDFLGMYRDDQARYMRFEGYTRSSDAAALFLRAGQQSNYELRAFVQLLPGRQFNSTATPYSGSGGDTLTLPSDWVRAPSTTLMTSLPTALTPVEIGWDWSVYGLGFDLSPGRRWTLRTDYTRREREGQARDSASFYFSALEFTLPVNYTTDDLEVELSYAADSWQAAVAYFGSVFKNDSSSLTFANPYLSGTGADAGQLALPPGNESHQLSLRGSILLPARTTLSGQLAVGHLTQNSDLLPYTTNPAFAAPLPTSSADAEADSINVNLRAVTSPIKDWSFEGELRFNKLDNSTAVNVYDYVVTDVVPAGEGAQNTRYDFARREIKLRAEYRGWQGTRLSAGLDTGRMERKRQDREDATINRLWLSMHNRLHHYGTLQIDVSAEDRGGSSYQAVEKPGADENPLMRKYNMADRRRTALKARGTMFPGERSDFALEIEVGRDDYDSTVIGLTETRYLRLGGDFSYWLGDGASAYAGLYHENITGEVRNSQSFSQPDWAGKTTDNFLTGNIGTSWPELVGDIGAEFEYLWSYSDGSTRNNTNGLRTDFPDVTHRRQSIRLGLQYPYSEALDFGLDLIYEDYDSSDWALENVEPATVPNLLALGADPWDYSTAVVYLNVRYRLAAD